VQTISREILNYTLSPMNKPVARVRPGETFRVETELNTGTWLKTLEDRLQADTIKLPYVNAASGPVWVEGARPGDMLVVHIEDIQVDELGYTAIKPGITTFPDWIRRQEWGLHTHVVRIRNRMVEWNDRLRIPIRPMIGVIGTAPLLEAVSTTDNGPHGGNLDIQEVCKGNTLFLPVFVEGALLHVGDAHAVQGDGEVCGAGGIETRSVCTLRVEVRPRPSSMTWPRIETPEHLVSIGCARPAEDAFRIAAQEMTAWLEEDYRFPPEEAVMLLGQILEARCTQFVNPKYSYVCKIPKRFLHP
jgi:acetamidase/formamidase